LSGDTRPRNTPQSNCGKVGVAEVYWPFEHRVLEKGDLPGFETAKAGGAFWVVKVRRRCHETASDVREVEVRCPFEHGVFEKSGVADFHAVEIGALFLVPKRSPFASKLPSIFAEAKSTGPSNTAFSRTMLCAL